MASLDPRSIEAADPNRRAAAKVSELERRVSAVERSRTGPAAVTVATLPAASAVAPGTIVFVSDGAAGTKWRGSDGTAWETLG